MGLQGLWDLSLGNCKEKQLHVRRHVWPDQAVEDWAVINEVTQHTTVHGLELTQGIDVLVCTGTPCIYDIVPAFYGLREWESVSLNGQKLYTNRPQYPPSSPQVLRWAQLRREEREEALDLPPPHPREIAGDRDIHMMIAAHIRGFRGMLRSCMERPGQMKI
ncbi:hypothetical protein EYF80_012588 [Liparis tanakae]|uniref:Uncharacterized protein n=1 Tax=Liparis tanakae TaxID=230148 RepID=A0A4Z2IHS1_9TELE|nr:hypothetical protein EYF80_012588 [Liparis tanakae]